MSIYLLVTKHGAYGVPACPKCGLPPSHGAIREIIEFEHLREPPEYAWGCECGFCGNHVIVNSTRFDEHVAQDGITITRTFQDQALLERMCLDAYVDKVKTMQPSAYS